jgi:hypothetical protein
MKNIFWSVFNIVLSGGIMALLIHSITQYQREFDSWMIEAASIGLMVEPAEMGSEKMCVVLAAGIVCIEISFLIRRCFYRNRAEQHQPHYGENGEGRTF